MHLKKPVFMAALTGLGIALIHSTADADIAYYEYNFQDSNWQAEENNGINNIDSATAWADTGGGDTIQAETRYLYYGGFGITSDRDETYSTAPSHAIDNAYCSGYDSGSSDSCYNGSWMPDDNEMILFSFEDDITLDTVSTGWRDTSVYDGSVEHTNGDTDIAIFAWVDPDPQTGADAPNTNLSGYTWTALEQGWTLVGHYTSSDSARVTGSGDNLTYTVNDGTDDLDTTTNTVYTSSYWLIGAMANMNGADADLDFYKLAALSGHLETPSVPQGGGPTPAPAPGTPALLGLGLSLIGLARKKIAHR